MADPRWQNLVRRFAAKQPHAEYVCFYCGAPFHEFHEADCMWREATDLIKEWDE